MSKKIILKSSDGELFEVDEAVAVQSVTIKHMIQDDCIDNGIRLPNVKSAVLAKVIEYCKKQVEDKDIYCPTVDTDLKNWESEFVDVDQPMLFDLILAADYLNVSGLLQLTCKTVADMMKGKTADQMRAIFHIKNDYTEKEEKEVREENDWDLK